MADMGEGGGGHDKKGKKKGKKGSPRIDMTPMVDLGFLLITFFILTTTMSKPQAMELNMPERDQKVNEEQKIKETHSLTVILTKNDKIIYFAGVTPQKALDENLAEFTDFSASGVRKIIQEQTKKMGFKVVDNKQINNIVIVIKSTDDAKYKNMVDILDEMAITKSKRYAIVDLLPVEKEIVKKLDS